MRTIFIVLVCIVAIAIHCADQTDCVGIQEKKQPAKASNAEIEKLVQQLGSSSGARREAAMKRLRDLPGARHYLRRNLQGKDLETRRRMEELIKEHARNEFKRHLRELAKEKGDAPLDLVVELLLENRNDVGEEQWKQTVEIVNAITVKISKEKKVEIPPPEFDYRE